MVICYLKEPNYKLWNFIKHKMQVEIVEWHFIFADKIIRRHAQNVYFGMCQIKMNPVMRMEPTRRNCAMLLDDDLTIY